MCYFMYSNACTYQVNKVPLSQLVQGHEPNNNYLKLSVLYIISLLHRFAMHKDESQIRLVEC